MLLRQSRSLKAKRRVINSLKNRIHNEFLCAVAEVDYLNNPQRICLGIAVIGNDRRVLDSALDKIRRFALKHPDAQFAQSQRNFYWGDDADTDAPDNIKSTNTQPEHSLPDDENEDFDSPIDIFADIGD